MFANCITVLLQGKTTQICTYRHELCIINICCVTREFKEKMINIRLKMILPIMVATIVLCGYIKYQKTEIEIAHFDYRMRVMKEESCRLQNGRGLFADESGDSENNTGYKEGIRI